MTISALTRIFLGVAISAFLCSSAVCQEPSKASQALQCFVVAPSYDYEISGRRDRVKGYVVRVDAPDQLGSPGLVLLVSGVDPGEGFATLNGHRYELPAQMGEAVGPFREKGKNQPGKEGW